MTNLRQEIYNLQEEIMQLGLQFAESAKDSVGIEHYKNIRAYFEANEYGEALHLINWIQENRSPSFGRKSEVKIQQIRDLADQIKRLYEHRVK